MDVNKNKLVPGRTDTYVMLAKDGCTGHRIRETILKVQSSVQTPSRASVYTIMSTRLSRKAAGKRGFDE